MVTDEETDTGGTIIASTSTLMSAGNAVVRVAKALGKVLSPSFERAAGYLGSAASVAAVAYEVRREDGFAHKTERGAAGAASTGLGMILGSASATTSEAAALTCVAGVSGTAVVAAAAPVLLTAVATTATAKMADLAIDNRRAYESFNQGVAEDAAPRKILSRPATEKPTILTYKHIASMLGVTENMRDSAISAPSGIERYAGSNRIKNFKSIDMTEPGNLLEYERALDQEIDRQEDIMRENDSLLPRWIRYGDSVEKYSFAQGELQNLLGAKDELAMFKREVQAYNDRTDMARAAKNDQPSSRPRSDSQHNRTASNMEVVSSPHDVVSQGSFAPAMSGALISSFGSAMAGPPASTGSGNHTSDLPTSFRSDRKTVTPV